MPNYLGHYLGEPVGGHRGDLNKSSGVFDCTMGLQPRNTPIAPMGGGI